MNHCYPSERNTISTYLQKSKFLTKDLKKEQSNRIEESINRKKETVKCRIKLLSFLLCHTKSRNHMGY